MSPLKRIRESFCKDIGTHAVGELVLKAVKFFGKAFMQPRNGHLVRAAYMTHGRVTASIADANHCCIVLVKGKTFHFGR